MNTTTVSIPGYRISEQLYNGCRTLVHRGYREADSLRFNPRSSTENL
ncbi:hypothetical protein [Nostoc sp.]